MAENGAPSFGRGLCGLSSMIDSTQDISQVSLFDGFEPSYGEDPSGSIEETVKEDVIEEPTRSSLDGKEGEGMEHQVGKVEETDDGPGSETSDGADGNVRVEGADGVDKNVGGDEARALPAGREGTPAATPASSYPGDPEDTRAYYVTSGSPPVSTPICPQIRWITSASDGSPMPPLMLAAKTLPSATAKAPSPRAPSPKRVTFNLEKNEVRIFSTQDGLDDPARGRIHPLLKRHRREINVATRARTADGANITSLNHLEHLLRVEMAVCVARSNYERLFMRMEDTVNALSDRGVVQ